MSKSVTFFVNRFPTLSQTFVIEQIEGLIELGHDVNVVALYPQNGSFVQTNDVLAEIVSNTQYIAESYVPPKNLRNCLISTLGMLLLLFSHPKRWPMFTAVLNIMLRRDLYTAHRLAYIGVNCEPVQCGDVVIAHFGDNGVIANILIKCQLMTAKQLTFFHGYEISVKSELALWGSFYKDLSKNSEKLLAISELWRTRLIELGVDEQKILVHHMGIRPDKFDFVAKPISSPIRVLSVARCTEKKGLTYAIDGVAKCKHSVHYKVIGGGGLFEKLLDQARSANTKNSIELVGPQQHVEVIKALHNSDIFLLPSITASSGDMEGIPVSLMEAMAMGVLVIATEHSGIPELVQNGVNGLLVPEGDPEAICSAIESVASGSLCIAPIRKKALETVGSEFNSVLLNASLSRLIESV